jgi:hypothetical protein
MGRTRVMRTMSVMSDATHPTTSDLAKAHVIASKAQCDVRTALRALKLGAEAIRPLVVRERVAAALREVP